MNILDLIIIHNKWNIDRKFQHSILLRAEKITFPPKCFSQTDGHLEL